MYDVHMYCTEQNVSYNDMVVRASKNNTVFTIKHSHIARMLYAFSWMHVRAAYERQQSNDARQKWNAYAHAYTCKLPK